MKYAPTPRDIQVLTLRRRFGLTSQRAKLLAELAFSEVRR